MQTETETTKTERTFDDVRATIAATAQAQAIGLRFDLNCGDGVHGLTAAEFNAVVEEYGAEVKAFGASVDHGAFRVAYVQVGTVVVKCYSRSAS